MAINKKALARAIVPYVYEEAENQGLTTNSGSERLSIEGEIEDPSGESDGLYVEATVKCSCDRDFPMDKDTGWRDSAEAKSLSYRVLDATVYDGDDQDIDVTDELQSALSWPDTYGPKKGLKKGWDDENLDEAASPEEIVGYNIQQYGDEIIEDVVRRLRKKYPDYHIGLQDLDDSDLRLRGRINGDLGEHGKETITYDVMINDMDSLSVFGIAILWNKVTVTLDGKTVDITDDLDEKYTGENLMPDVYDGEYGDDDYYSDEEDLDEEKKTLCESFKSSILVNLVKKHGRVKYSQSNGSARKEVTIPLHLYTDDQLRDCVLKVSGKYLGFDGRDFTKPSTINNGSFGKGYRVYFEDGSILFIPSTKSTAPTQQQRDHYSKTFAKKRDKGTLKESAEDLNYEEILEAILDNVCEKLEAKYPDYNDSYDVDIDDEDMSAKGVVKGLFGGDRELTVRYVINLDSVDEIQPYGISGTISRAIVVENGKSRDITDQMQELGW